LGIGFGRMMQQFDLKDYLSTRKALVDSALEQLVPRPAGLQQSVLEAARYSLFAGGKRLRPILCMAAAEVVGSEPESVLPAACALELIHTYSLIHDDLPAMDNDDFRRGRPTCHKAYGEAMAILAGDALLTEAFGLVARFGLNYSPAAGSAATVLRVVEILARASGYQGMIGGQVIDLEAEQSEVDLETLEAMHRHKTGALICGALEIGALLGGGDAEQTQSLVRFGRHFGLAFQITDDLLDVEGDPAVMGKPAGSDQARNKKTYPAVLGMEATRAAARDHVVKAIEVLADFDEKALPLKEMACYLPNRKA